MAEALFKALIRSYEKAYYNKRARKSKEVVGVEGWGGGTWWLAQSHVIFDGG